MLREIIHHFDDFGVEEALVRGLLRADPSLRLVPLRDLVRHTRELVEATASHHVAQYIGVQEVGRESDIIWAPSPLDKDWFERLAKERHAGRRIVITTTKEARDAFKPFATDVVEIPGWRNTVQKICEALRRQR
ncbi:MAG: hypothetical protein V1908_00800 [Candidatus Peregrinibacteria bacterium]